ncbi:hypothetical protein CRE_24547 [Caenorhabditis remanei]|uniref:Uncharacterized protein n=1 Tax=Caenorhabditis remanei TaxID=31234 RepID=E3MVC4_CAERE|nr:hypothetical protein CRE_24547 [Caenorhabditis remanei]
MHPNYNQRGNQGPGFRGAYHEHREGHRGGHRGGPWRAAPRSHPYQRNRGYQGHHNQSSFNRRQEEFNYQNYYQDQGRFRHAPSQPYRQHDQQLQHPPMEGYNHFSQRNYQQVTFNHDEGYRHPFEATPQFHRPPRFEGHVNPNREVGRVASHRPPPRFENQQRHLQEFNRFNQSQHVAPSHHHQNNHRFVAAIQHGDYQNPPHRQSGVDTTPRPHQDPHQRVEDEDLRVALFPTETRASDWVVPPSRDSRVASHSEIDEEFQPHEVSGAVLEYRGTPSTQTSSSQACEDSQSDASSEFKHPLPFSDDDGEDEPEEQEDDGGSEVPELRNLSPLPFSDDDGEDDPEEQEDVESEPERYFRMLSSGNKDEEEDNRNDLAEADGNVTFELNDNESEGNDTSMVAQFEEEEEDFTSMDYKKDKIDPHVSNKSEEFEVETPYEGEEDDTPSSSEDAGDQFSKFREFSKLEEECDNLLASDALSPSEKTGLELDKWQAKLKIFLEEQGRRFAQNGVDQIKKINEKIKKIIESQRPQPTSDAPSLEPTRSSSGMSPPGRSHQRFPPFPRNGTDEEYLKGERFVRINLPEGVVVGKRFFVDGASKSAGKNSSHPSTSSQPSSSKTSSEPAQKRIIIKFTPEQVEKLNRRFSESQSIKPEERTKMGEEMGKEQIRNRE